MLKSASKVYGASSGSIIAALTLCECDIDEWSLSLFNILANSRWYQLAGKNVIKILRNALNKHLPTNAHQLVRGKLHVIVTRLRDCTSVAVSEFTSKEDLIQAIVCSCYVPLWFGILPPVYHGVRYVDGEIGMWRANFVSRTMITISSFAGEYDICPREGTAAFFTFQISDCILQISKRNLCRLMNIVVMPSFQVLEKLYAHGYQDTVSYLKRLNAFDINYLDEDFLRSLANESHQKGEGTLHWKPETRLLHSRATDSEDVSEKKLGAIQAAEELDEKALHHILHHQKVWTEKTSELLALQVPVSPAATSGIQRSMCWSVVFLSLLLFIYFSFLSLPKIQNLSA